MLSGIFCCRASDWELMKFDNNYAEINSSAGLVLSISKVEYRDVTSEVAHMSELMGCDRPVFEKDNKNFTVKNCKIGSARQNIYARQLEQNDGKKTPATYLQVYLIGDSLPAGAEFEKEALSFLEKTGKNPPFWLRICRSEPLLPLIWLNIRKKRSRKGMITGQDWPKRCCAKTPNRTVKFLS